MSVPSLHTESTDSDNIQKMHRGSHSRVIRVTVRLYGSRVSVSTDRDRLVG